MQIPVQISFRDFPHSDSVEANIRERVARLEKFYDRITSCRVVVESSHRRHERGNLYHVRIEITVPDERIVVARTPALEGAHKDLYVAIRDAFNAAQRKLQDHVKKRRVRVHLRHREEPPHARIIRLLYDDGGYGFIGTGDGREIYFHRNSVLDDKFDFLQVGDEVRFSEEPGDEGPQASTVELVGRDGKHRLPHAG